MKELFFNFPQLSENICEMKEKKIKENYPKFYKYLYVKYPNIKKWTEKLYLFYNGMNNPPKCANPNCNSGKSPRFVSLYMGYLSYCSRNCSHNAEDVRKNISKGLRKKFLKDNKDIIKNIINNVCICNCTNPNNCPLWNTCDHEFKIKLCTLQGRRGRGEEICTIINNYRVKITELKKFKYAEEHSSLIIKYLGNDKYLYKCPHPNNCPLWETCNHEYAESFQKQYRRIIRNNETCNKLIKHNPCASKPERELRKIFKDLNIECNYNNRKTIYNDITGKGLELDVVPKNYSIVFEFNGSYYHSIECHGNTKNQHVMKFIKCLEKGLELISIWEDWDFDLVGNLIKDKLEGKSLDPYKKLLFPDLNNNEWPNDLGFYNKYIPIPEEILEHCCIHNNFECYDSGVIKVPNQTIL